MVKAKNLEQTEIIKAIKNGEFYSSTGPYFYKIKKNEKKVEVECSEVSIINFICNTSKGGRIYGEKLTKAEFELSGNEKYIRIEIVDAYGKKAFSNPIFI